MVSSEINTIVSMDAKAKKQLDKGIVIPAHPLALDANRKLDERRQRALSRYYIDSGAGGLAVGVHTTQFQIRDPKIGLFKPVLELASEEMDRADSKRDAPMVRIAGIAGQTAQAVHEAQLLADLGYHAGLLSLSAMKDADLTRLITHCKTVADVIPLVGFYLQPAVGGVVLPYSMFTRITAHQDVFVGAKMLRGRTCPVWMCRSCPCACV